MQFVDLKRQYDAYRTEIMSEIMDVLETSTFINGPALQEFEVQLTEYLGTKYAIGCSSGTDALTLGMLALGVRPGDEIIVPDFTFIATAETVALLGAVPVFADVQYDTLNLDPESVKGLISSRTVGIIPVSLYGQTADMDEIQQIANERGLWVMEDGAQSFGATYKSRKSCALCRIGTTSFFPAKPLGGYGDGGAVFTDDEELASKMRMILNHGQRKRYDHAVVGMNARLDTLQAAVLKVKLRHFDDELQKRQGVAELYTEKLRGIGGIGLPTIRAHNTSSWAQYTLRVANRDHLQKKLNEAKIPTAIHYPIPLHLQEAFRDYGQSGIERAVTEKASREVLSLPMHPFLSEAEIDFVVEHVSSAAGE